MKICFIVPKAYPLFSDEIKGESYGGAEVQIVSLARELAKQEDIEVTVVTGIYNDESQKVEIFDKVEVVQAIQLKGNIWRKFKNILKFFKWLKIINARYYIQRGLTPFTFGFALWSKLNKKKFVYMVASDGETEIGRAHV